LTALASSTDWASVKCIFQLPAINGRRSVFVMIVASLATPSHIEGVTGVF
jgi:hypothetical protein